MLLTDRAAARHASRARTASSTMATAQSKRALLAKVTRMRDELNTHIAALETALDMQQVQQA
ncbi:MAG TPA: hypothetical protein VF818_06740 [Ktedonobacterales bacterium]